MVAPRNQMMGKEPNVKSAATEEIASARQSVWATCSREPMNAPTTWSEGTQMAIDPRRSAATR